MGDEASSYFTEHLGFEVRLLYIGGNGQRAIPGATNMFRRYGAISAAAMDIFQPQRLRFADAAPLLVTTTASEEDARRRLPMAHRNEDVIIRFRPNIHIEVGQSGEAYDEDYWTLLSIRSKGDQGQEVSVQCLFRTVRCLSLNADLQNGTMIAAPRQLYGLLARDRRVNDKFPSEFVLLMPQCTLIRLTILSDKPVFGQYACAGPSGAVLRIGDEVEVVQRSRTPNPPLDVNAASPR